MPVCIICKIKQKDLQYHLKREHNLSTKCYKEKYGGLIVDQSVEEKRKETCFKRYGDPNYKNKEAAKLSNEIYEGGHSLKDPSIRSKASDTMEKRYGKRHFTNREKAKETTLKRYGYEYTCQIPEVIEKRRATLIKRYGKIFNVDGPHNKWHPESEEEFKKDFMSGMSYDDICVKYKICEPTLTRVVKGLGMKREFVQLVKRVYETPGEAVVAYFVSCKDKNKVLSFYEYGNIKGSRNLTKMKRLFNVSGKFSSLKEELFEVALCSEKHQEFLEKLR